jgi:predicted nucleic acid-binding protein
MNILDLIPPGTLIAFDTAPFIYFLEGHARFGPLLTPVFHDRLEAGLNQGITSVVTLAEVLVQPLALSRADLVQVYQNLFTQTPYLTLADITPPVAEQAAMYRARYALRLPDALQLAVVTRAGAAVLVTNDARLRKVTELQVLVLQDYLAAGP